MLGPRKTAHAGHAESSLALELGRALLAEGGGRLWASSLYSVARWRLIVSGSTRFETNLMYLLIPILEAEIARLGPAARRSASSSALVMS